MEVIRNREPISPGVDQWLDTLEETYIVARYGAQSRNLPVEAIAAAVEHFRCEVGGGYEDGEDPEVEWRFRLLRDIPMQAVDSLYGDGQMLHPETIKVLPLMKELLEHIYRTKREQSVAVHLQATD